MIQGLMHLKKGKDLKFKYGHHMKDRTGRFLTIGNRGIALMMILWILFLLNIIVLQFASTMRKESEITRNFKDRIEAYYLARAAVEIAQYELTYVASASKNEPVASTEGMIDFRAGTAQRDVNPQWNRKIALGRGICHIDYRVMEDKYDLNYLALKNHNDLEEVLVACGMELQSPELSMVKQSIIDWADPKEDMSGPDIGAEDDWYEDHWEGYECKDDRFYAVEELAFIRGLRPERGDSEEERREKKRLLSELYKRVTAHPFLTHSKINLNVATMESMDVKYDEDQIDTYKTKRDEGQSIDRMRPTHYEVIATGWVDGSFVKRQIKAEFQIKGRRRVQILSWSDNYIPMEEWDPNQESAWEAYNES